MTLLLTIQIKLVTAENRRIDDRKIVTLSIVMAGAKLGRID